MSVNPEKYLLSSVLREHDMPTAMSTGIDTSMFHAFPEEWDWLEGYYARYKKTPSKVAFINQFPEFVIKNVNDTRHFADEVRRGHARFLMTSMISEAADKIADGNVEAAALVVHSQIVTVAAAMGTNNDGDIFADYGDVYTDVERRVARVAEHGSAGIPTGFTTLDERTGGPAPGQFWVVGARLGEGKSWTMQKWATAAVMHGYTVQFDALEQSKTEVTMRIHGFMSSDIGKDIFKTSDLMQGRDFNLSEYKQFLRRLKKEVPGKLHIADTSRGRIGLTAIASQIERNKPDIVFVDYITLMQKAGSEWQDVAALSSGIKVLAQEYQIPIVAAAQLNRDKGLGKEPPGPEALAQSDAIGQDADAIVTIKQNSPHTMTQKVVKNRNGAGGFKWYNEFDPSRGVFREISHDKFLSLRDVDAQEEDEATHTVRQSTRQHIGKRKVSTPPKKRLSKS